MKMYSIRLKYGTMIKNLYFQIEDGTDADEKWNKAGEDLEEIGDSCTNGPEFFEKAIANYKRYGFQRIAK